MFNNLAMIIDRISIGSSYLVKFPNALIDLQNFADLSPWDAIKTYWHFTSPLTPEIMQPEKEQDRTYLFKDLESFHPIFRPYLEECKTQQWPNYNTQLVDEFREFISNWCKKMDQTIEIEFSNNTQDQDQDILSNSQKDDS